MARIKLHGSEHDHQVAVFDWIRAHEHIEPVLKLAYAIPNGGMRHAVVAAKLKKEGVKAGVPDICIPVCHLGPDRLYIGLYLEMKVKPNKPTKEQQEWIRLLRGRNHCVEVCYSADEAIEVIKKYFEMK